MYGKVSAFGVHLFNVDLYSNLKAGIAHMAYAAYQFYNGTCRNWFLEIYFIAAYRHHYLAAKAGGGDKGNLVHHMHGGAAKQGIVMVGGIWEHGLKNARF